MSEFKVRSLVRQASVALAATALAFTIAGCGKTDNGGNTNVTGGQTTHITGPTGNVIGAVVGDNGNPLPGVTVAIGNQTATTNAQGTYELDNVPVNFTATPLSFGFGFGGGGFDGYTGQYITLSMTAPGHMSATVVLTALSQCVAGCVQGVGEADGGNGVSNSGDDNDDNKGSGGDANSAGSVTNPQTVFVSGYTASAGTVELPGLTATIAGTLRDRDTGTALGGVPLYAHYLGPVSTSQSPYNSASHVVTYGTGSGSNFQIAGGQTDSQGVFSFGPALPADGCYAIYGDGYNITRFSSDNGGTDIGFPESCSEYTDADASVQHDIVVSSVNSPVQLNQIYAWKSPNADKIAPWVSAVDNASYVDVSNNSCGTLDSTVTNSLTVHFDEPVTVNFAANNMPYVIVGRAPNKTVLAVTAVSPTGTPTTTLTLTLAGNIPQPADVTVNIPVNGVQDQGGNFLTANDNAPVGYDAIATSTSPAGGSSVSVENVYDTLCFNSFKPGSTSTASFTIEQIDPVKNTSTLLAYQNNNALIDNVGDTEVGSAVNSSGNTVNPPSPNFIEQFNNGVPTTPAVADNLTDLFEALTGSSSGGPVLTHGARIHFTVPAGAQDMVFALVDPITGNTKDVLFFPMVTPTCPNLTAEGEVADGNAAVTSSDTPTPVINQGGKYYYSLNPNGATSCDVFIGSASAQALPGDKLVVISRAGTGIPGQINSQEADLTLTDQVGPTVALQLLGDANVIQAANNFGQGGVVYQPNPGEPGIVVLNVTPQTGDTSEASTVNNGTTSGYSGDNFADELYANSGIKAAVAGATAAPPFAANGGVFPHTVAQDSAGQDIVATDATGTAWYLSKDASDGGDLNAIVSLDVSEPVNIVSGVTSVPNTGAATLTGPVALDSVPNENVTAHNDVVNATVSNVLQLATDGRNGAILDLTPVIVDNPQGNAAVPDSKLLVEDKFPPLMTMAFYDGQNYYFQFNEPVLKEGHINLACSLSAGAYTGGAVAALAQSNVKQSVDGTVIAIPGSDFVFAGGTTSLSQCFGTSADNSGRNYGEAAYTPASVNAVAAAAGVATTVTTVPATFDHGAVGYFDVPDSEGNIWDCSYGNLGQGNGAAASSSNTSGDPATFCTSPRHAPADAKFVWAGTHLGIGYPAFMGVSLIGPFSLAFTAPDLRQDATTFHFTISSTHPVGNWFTDQSSATPNGLGPVFKTSGCTASTFDGSVPVSCNGTWVAGALTLAPNGATPCTIDTATSSATLMNATTLEFTVACATNTQVNTGQAIGVNGVGTSVDSTTGTAPNTLHQARSNLNGQLGTVLTTVTAN